MSDPRQTLARCIGAFFDELARGGVRDVVISPGSRSTPLAMVAYELARRAPERLRITVDVDERGAAFCALGAAKASGRPAAFLCTSGTAVANAYPAVMEASYSRVPLIVLTGDRPPRLQELGAPQTTDQLKVFGTFPRAFREMPLPAADASTIALFRQAAREACIQSLGGRAVPLDGASPIASRGCAAYAGPIHLNFPFEEPLVVDLSLADLFDAGRGDASASGLIASTSARLDEDAIADCEADLARGNALLLAGEGSCETLADAEAIVAFARRFALPVLADPLSGLRSLADGEIIDSYDRVFGETETLAPDVVIRFGRYPISKAATRAIEAARPFQIVVDRAETRDFNAATSRFVPLTPLEFAASAWRSTASERQRAYLAAWKDAGRAARAKLNDLIEDGRAVEGAYVSALIERAPAESLLFSANSMAVRAIDSFYEKRAKPLAVLANRALNGIDGTISTAIGAAAFFPQATLLIGDLAMLHDVNALVLQRELLQRATPPSLVIVVLNNNGGAIFDMLPQASDDPYFERLFLTPQNLSFRAIAEAFGVPARAVASPDEFGRAYDALLGTPGLSLIEIDAPLRGLVARYGRA